MIYLIVDITTGC